MPLSELLEKQSCNAMKGNLVIEKEDDVFDQSMNDDDNIDQAEFPSSILSHSSSISPKKKTNKKQHSKANAKKSNKSKFSLGLELSLKTKGK